MLTEPEHQLASEDTEVSRVGRTRSYDEDVTGRRLCLGDLILERPFSSAAVPHPFQFVLGTYFIRRVGAAGSAATRTTIVVVVDVPSSPIIHHNPTWHPSCPSRSHVRWDVTTSHNEKYSQSGPRIGTTNCNVNEQRSQRRRCCHLKTHTMNSSSSHTHPTPPASWSTKPGGRRSLW